jgi:hypothetical protein
MGGHHHFTRRRLAGLLAQAGLAGAVIRVVEARVWPFASPGAQRFFDRLQDLAEALPPLRPLLCYHVARWEKPHG